MYLVGIFESRQGNYYWYDCLDEWETREAKYFVDNDNQSGCHVCDKSAYWGEIEDDYVDAIQDEYDLKDGELYVVTYYAFKRKGWCLDQLVDFGLTKQEIIQNVLDQKYVEGASYYTMGQMFYETRKVMEGK